TEDGEIPAGEEPNWLTYNSFRQNEQGEGVFNAPDLKVELWLDTNSCPSGLELVAKVMNVGALGVAPGLPVSFYYGTENNPGDYLGTAETTEAVLPGGSTLVTYDYVVPEGGVKEKQFFARVDDKGDGTGTQNECNEDNNTGETKLLEGEVCDCKDNDCDGLVDEDQDMCSSPTACIECGCREPCTMGECPAGFKCVDNYCVPK
ncbi:MAG: hypothetical protein GXP49_01150, partial [Deltaproteobacteria bacterium]|nr:hypothetical protein [Deltaproteobacteria bacterium]